LEGAGLLLAGRRGLDRGLVLLLLRGLRLLRVLGVSLRLRLHGG
jgi:hypothetical protein